MHEIINSNCYEYMQTIEDESVQCIISSPPYCLNKSYESKQSIQDYLSHFPQLIQQFKRILKSSGSIFWQVGNYVKDGEIIPLDILFYDLFKNENFKLRNRIIWHFEHGLHCKKRFSGRYEVILFFTKSDNYVFNLDDVRIPSKYPNKKYFKGKKMGQLSCNPLGKNPSDVFKIVQDDWDKEIWDIPNVKFNHPEKTSHPCSFPVELCERCILAASNEGDIVFDPFCGSGSAIIAAVKNNRIGIGTDIMKEYCDLAIDRLKLLSVDKLKTRPIDKQIYSPR